MGGHLPLEQFLVVHNRVALATLIDQHALVAVVRPDKTIVLLDPNGPFDCDLLPDLQKLLPRGYSIVTLPLTLSTGPDGYPYDLNSGGDCVVLSLLMTYLMWRVQPEWVWPILALAPRKDWVKVAYGKLATVLNTEPDAKQLCVHCAKSSTLVRPCECSKCESCDARVCFECSFGYRSLAEGDEKKKYYCVGCQGTCKVDMLVPDWFNQVCYCTSCGHGSGDVPLGSKDCYPCRLKRCQKKKQGNGRENDQYRQKQGKKRKNAQHKQKQKKKHKHKRRHSK